MPRLFAALEIPAEASAMIAGLRGGLPGARWIDTENYHITLRFIGDVDDRTAAEAADTLADIRRSAFPVRLRNVASFGGRKPRSIHAEVEPSEPLFALQADIERRLQRIGLPPEQRRFTPHVTVARLRSVSGSSVAAYLGTRGLFSTSPFVAERFVLLSSRASRGGGPYVVEDAYPLDDHAQPVPIEQHA